MIIEDMLELTLQKNASDLHISAEMPPVLRIDGKLVRTNLPVLTSEDVEKLLFPILTNEQRRTLEQTWELDFGYGLRNLGRFRANIYKDKGSYAAAFRSINSEPPSFESLGLPDVVKQIADKPRGLILVTGPTGSGKSTTLAAMIDYINSTRAEHILTIEDPIEYVHTSKKSVVHQRELGQDTKSTSNALRSALREDPDVILIGEMRDLESMSLALTAAETGHLVMATLHTSSASQTIDRLVDAFPEGQQQQIRLQLSTTLLAVFSQTLVPKLQPNGEKSGRVMAQEILVVTGAVANLIREQKTAQIYSVIQTGSSLGMQTLDMALKNLYMRGDIDENDAMAKAHNKEEFMRLVGLSERRQIGR